MWNGERVQISLRVKSGKEQTKRCGEGKQRMGGGSWEWEPGSRKWGHLKAKVKGGRG